MICTLGEGAGGGGGGGGGGGEGGHPLDEVEVPEQGSLGKAISRIERHGSLIVGDDVQEDCRSLLLACMLHGAREKVCGYPLAPQLGCSADGQNVQRQVAVR